MPHVDEAMLHAWLDGETSAGRDAAIQSHLTECEACQAQLEEVVRIHATAAGLVAAAQEEPMPPWEQIVTRAESTDLPAEPGSMGRGMSQDGVSERQVRPTAANRRLWFSGLAWTATLVLAFALGWSAREPARPEIHERGSLAQLEQPEREAEPPAAEPPAAALQNSPEELGVPVPVPSQAVLGEAASAGGETQSDLMSQKKARRRSADLEAAPIQARSAAKAPRLPREVSDIEAAAWLGEPPLRLQGARLASQRFVSAPGGFGLTPGLALEIVYDDPQTGATVTLWQQPVQSVARQPAADSFAPMPEVAAAAPVGSGEETLEAMNRRAAPRSVRWQVEGLRVVLMASPWTDRLDAIVARVHPVQQ